MKNYGLPRYGEVTPRRRLVLGMGPLLWGGQVKRKDKRKQVKRDLTLIVRTSHTSHGPLLKFKEKELVFCLILLALCILAKLFTRLYSESKEA